MIGRPNPSFSPARAALQSARTALITAGAFSGAVNVLMLAGPLFMLQVYDRVLPSHSTPTLIALVVLVLMLYTVQAALEVVRSRLFVRIGRQVDADLVALAFETNLSLGVLGQGAAKAPSPFRDLEQIRSFLAGGGPSAFFDLPWMPLYLALLFALHPWLGVMGVIGACLLAGLAVATDRATSPHQRDFGARAAEAGALADASRRNAETVVPLGMTEALAVSWRERNRAASSAQLTASDMSSGLSGASRFVRMTLQSMVLAVGAYLVMSGKASGGVMIAASITLGRALAPVEVAIVHWRGFIAARQAFGRLELLFRDKAASEVRAVSLPAPTRALVVEHIFAGAPGVVAPFVKDISFALAAGDALAIIGPSGSGKSTLVRALLGLWPVQRGAIRLDGSTLDQWTRAESGRWIGYLPQTVELFAGTIGQNIARFDPEATSEAILKAARAAGVDELIRGLPDGFDTMVGEAGAMLSVGQRQRIALARALFREPFLLILDEPNSSLDAEGEMALAQALMQVRQRGGIAIVVAHRPGAVQAATHVLAMAAGAAKAFGPRDDVLKHVLAPRPVAGAARARGAAQ
jgi:PrtD family type I secretion system ABC transporter